MEEPRRRWTSEWKLGRHVAPPRFVLFAVVFALGAGALVPWAGWSRGAMGGFDIAAAAFLVSLARLFRHDEVAQMRRTAQANDANRTLLLAITAAVMLVILVAVHAEVRGRTGTLAVVLVIATLALAWAFSNMVYALHYAHLFYSERDGRDAGGLDFPGTAQPDYWDFVYFSYTLGMTFQTSDVTVSDGVVRRVVTGQCLAAFVFNLGVLAFSINVLGGG